MAENTINQNAAAAFVRVSCIEDMARGLAGDMLLMFGDLGGMCYGAGACFEVPDAVECLAKIKDLADAAVKSGDDRIFSGYDTEHGKIWIITEWDRSYSTVMFPSEY